MSQYMLIGLSALAVLAATGFVAKFFAIAKRELDESRLAEPGAIIERKKAAFLSAVDDADEAERRRLANTGGRMRW